jgi:hypothetical protein
MADFEAHNLYYFYYVEGYEFCLHLGTFSSRVKAVEAAKREADRRNGAPLPAPHVLFGRRPPSGTWLRDTHPHTRFLCETVSVTFEEAQ